VSPGAVQGGAVPNSSRIFFSAETKIEFPTMVDVSVSIADLSLPQRRGAFLVNLNSPEEAAVHGTVMCTSTLSNVLDGIAVLVSLNLQISHVGNNLVVRNTTGTDRVLQVTSTLF